MIKNKRQKSDVRAQFIQLAAHLRQESLYVTSERSQLKRLNEKILFKWQDVIHSTWIARQQRVTLEVSVAAAAASGSNSDLASAARIYNALERVKFIESYKILGPVDVQYSELLSVLRRDTHMLARILAGLERNPLESSTFTPGSPSFSDRLAEIVMTSLYGNCLFSEDRTLVAALLRELITVQLIGNHNPRRLLRQGNCMMARIYKHFSDGLFETKIYLTAALQPAVLLVLQQDDLYLDVDANRNVSRFAADERLRHFGVENSPEYDRNLERYKTWTITRLVTLVTHFIDGIQKNVACFPAWITWLIRQLTTLLKDQLTDQELGVIGSDLIFGLFICPAILNPELNGITEAHISHIARYNLMQIAQIIQRLAMSRWDSSYAPTSADSTSKMEPIFSRLPREGIFNILDIILGQSPSAGPPPMPQLDENDIHRNSVLITHSQLIEFLRALHHITGLSSSSPPAAGTESGSSQSANLPADTSKESLEKLTEILRQIPIPDNVTTTPSNSHPNTIDKRELNRISPIGLPAASSPINNARNLLSKVTRKSSSRPSVDEGTPQSIGPGSSGTGSSTRSGERDSLIAVEDVVVIPLNSPSSARPELNVMSEQSLHSGIGLQGEERVMIAEMESGRKKSKVRVQLDSHNDQLMETESVVSATSGEGGPGPGTPSSVPNMEKRTRFSLSVDQESVGTCDNLEAISEAASNHSVDSSLETGEEEEDGMIGDENESENLINDNLSDMVSANVSSGRGSPNVSGRDSPISRDSSTESDDNDEPRGAGAQINNPPVPDGVPVEVPGSGPAQSPASGPILGRSGIVIPPGRQTPRRHPPSSGMGAAAALKRIPVTHQNRLNNREDIEDRFGKFDVKHQVLQAGDETKSIMSDTWSTDVLASDTEQPDQPERSTPSISGPHGSGMGSRNAGDIENVQMNLMHFPAGAVGVGGPAGTMQVFRDESQSDAWSTSVAASDTARFQDFDVDETASSIRSESLIDRSELEDPPQIIQQPMPTVHVNQQDRTPKSKMLIVIDDSSDQCDKQEETDDDVDPHRLTASTDSTDTVQPTVTLRSPSNTLVGSSNRMGSGATTPNSFGTTISHRQTLGRLSLDISKLDEMTSNGNGPNSLSPTSPIPCVIGEGTAAVQNGNSVVDILSMDVSNLAISSNNNPTQAGQQEDDGVLIDLESVSPNSEVFSSGPSSNPPAGRHPARPHNGIPSAASGAIPKVPRSQHAHPHPHPPSGSSSSRQNSGKRSLFRSLPNSIKATLKDKIRLPTTTTTTNQPASGMSRHDRSTHPQRPFSQHNGLTGNISDSLSPGSPTAPAGMPRNESSDDILEKYRSPRPTSSNTLVLRDNGNRSHGDGGPQQGDTSADEPDRPMDEATIMLVARRKLRRVLSQMDVHNLPLLPSNSGIQSANSSMEERQGDNAIVRLLSVLLAEATCLQNSNMVVNLHEAIRTIAQLDDVSCAKLLSAVREDFQRRSIYVTYLARSRNQLLSIQSQLEHMLAILRRESSTTVHNFISTFVRQYLEIRDDGAQMSEFVSTFEALSTSQPPAPPDEKTICVQQFLHAILSEMQNDPSWQSMTEDQRQLAERLIERIIMREIYIYAFYPNGDGDVMRDQLLYDHIQRLSTCVTVNHRDLRIHRRFQCEAPWPTAQAEIATINAYKSPRDKVHCVVQTCSILMNLLSHAAALSLPLPGSGRDLLASSSSGGSGTVPAADDLIPVLVFVIIKANPPCLLSTVQFVNGFYMFESEEEYWWTLFSSAIEFIKTMD